MTLPRSTTDVLVVGGGPAGLAAAAQAAAAGLSVTLVEERVTLGGQIFKRMGPGFEVDDPRTIGRDYAAGSELIARVTRAQRRDPAAHDACSQSKASTAIVCEDECADFSDRRATDHPRARGL